MKLSLTVDTSVSEVHRCIRSAMLTSTVSGTGLAGTYSPLRVRSCRDKIKNVKAPVIVVGDNMFND